MKNWYKIIPSEENRVLETVDKVWGGDHAICVRDGRQVRWCSQPPLVRYTGRLWGLGWPGWGPSPRSSFLFLPAMDSLHLFSQKKNKHRNNVNMGANEHSILKTSKLFLVMG